MASSRVHTTLARIAFALAPLFLIGTVFVMWRAMKMLALPEDRDVFELAAGTWG